MYMYYTTLGGKATGEYIYIYMLLTRNNHVAVLGDRLEGGCLARNFAPEAARRLQIDVAQRNNRVARVV